MYWASRLLGRPVIVRLGPYVGLGQAKLELAERWCARYGPPGVFFSRLLPVIRHLIGIPTGILRMRLSLLRARHSRRFAAFGAAVLAWLGKAVGQHPELLAGSLHRFFALVLAVAAVLAVLYYVLRASAAGTLTGVRHLLWTRVKYTCHRRRTSCVIRYSTQRLPSRRSVSR